MIAPVVADMSFDENASRALVAWGRDRNHCTGELGDDKLNESSVSSGPWSDQVEQSIAQNGICPRYGAQLSSIQPTQWAGLLVRPIELPASDPASFAVSGPNVEGLCASSPLPEEMAQRLPVELHQSIDGVPTYFTYAQFHFGTRIRSVVKWKHPINLDIPLFTAVRISRHLDAANVSD